MQQFQAATRDFLSHCQFEKNLSPKTLEAYRIDLKQFRHYLHERHTVDRLEGIDKSVLREYLETISGYKPKTIKRKVATLKALFNFLEFEDQIEHNPFRKMRIRIREAKDLPVQLSYNEVVKFIRTVYKEKEKVRNVESYQFASLVRDAAVVELLFATGIRVSELCHLQAKHVDLRSGTIQVRGKGNKERIIQVYHVEVRAILKEYRALFAEAILETGNFFVNRHGRPLSDQSVRNMVRKYAQQAEISKHVTPHTFRHTFATLLLEQDVDIKYIQHLLGHSSIMTTQIYTHVNKSKQRRILANKHPRKRFVVG